MRSSTEKLESDNALHWARNLPCVVCGKPDVDPHHFPKTKGAGGKDVKENLLPLCRNHHSECHQVGAYTFYLKNKSNIDSFRQIHGLPKVEMK